MASRNTIELVEDGDGSVRAEVATRSPIRERDIRGLEPHEYLQRGAIVSCTGVSPEEAVGFVAGWRYVYLSVVVDSNHRRTERWLNLSHGSGERQFLERALQQGSLRFMWVNEGLEGTYSFPQELQEACREALVATVDVSPEAWKEEIADIKWAHTEAGARGQPRPRRHRRRSAQPPSEPIPFFASRSGAIPSAGRPSIAGQSLPVGSRRPEVGAPAAYWATDEQQGSIVQLARRLAETFSQTGLWPLLWAWPEEPPDNYLTGHGDLNAIDAVLPESVLRGAWEALPSNPAATKPFTAFPGLAPGRAPRPDDVDPFGRLAQEAPGGARGRLVLVPCNRPADALTALGHAQSIIPVATISAVLRSWEVRFAAVVVRLGPSTTTLTVGAPPTELEHALQLAAEIYAITERTAHAGALRELAESLLDRPERAGATASPAISPRLWQLVFRE
jgi:hypothetical protein